MEIITIIKKLSQKQDLTIEESSNAMKLIMSGENTPAQTATFLSLLSAKGESSEEITGMAKVMREFGVKVEVDMPLLDTCGTGGSGLPRLNVSTASAFVLAAAGVKIAKHGNRASGGRCGSFDVLETLGARIELNAKYVKKSIEEIGLGFMFAPLFHPAMKNVAPVRKEIGIRTVFNILGPLTNPANVKYQVLGVSDESIAPKMIEVLKNLGSKKVLLIHGKDGLDEITVAAETKIWELNGGDIKEYEISPEQFGMQRVEFSAIAGGNAQENADVIRKILNNKITDARLDIILLNVAGGLIAYEKAESFEEGIEIARETIESGKAGRKLEEYIKYSNTLN
ncbi:MAG: anthranilate phosphoribosyltransferase [bacterium]